MRSDTFLSDMYVVTRLGEACAQRRRVLPDAYNRQRLARSSAYQPSRYAKAFRSRATDADLLTKPEALPANDAL